MDQILVILPGERQGAGCDHQDNKKMKKAWKKARGEKEKKATLYIHCIEGGGG